MALIDLLAQQQEDPDIIRARRQEAQLVKYESANPSRLRVARRMSELTETLYQTTFIYANNEKKQAQLESSILDTVLIEVAQENEKLNASK